MATQNFNTNSFLFLLNGNCPEKLDIVLCFCETQIIYKTSTLLTFV